MNQHLWKWMENKNYISDDVDTTHDGIIFDNTLYTEKIEKIPKQMLTGYIIEYLVEYHIPFAISCDALRQGLDLYEMLNEKVRKVK